MMSFMMMALGAYRFSVFNGGFQQTERETEWRWVPLDVIGSAPRLQYIGPGADSLTINGVIHPHYRGGLGQIPAMKAQAGRGVPLSLIDGMGLYHGVWSIVAVREGQTTFLPDGAPRKIEFGVKLLKYS